MNYKQNYKDSLAIITLDDLNSLLKYTPTDEVSAEEITSALVCASVRVDELCGGQILMDFDKLQEATQIKVKLAACFIAQYYLSGGYSWLRGSTSLNAGQISVSQSFPDEPDYLIPAIKPLLQINEENLYKPTFSLRNNFSDTQDDFTPNRYKQTVLTWQDADKMYMRPNNFQSTDASVIIENAVPVIGEPKLNFRVRVSEINKYKSDNKTIAIDNNNVITATGVEFDGVFYSAKDIKDALIKRATYSDLEQKVDRDFNNTDLKQLISTDLLNDLKLSTNDKKLYVHLNNKPSGSGTYYGDGKTTKIDNNNVISAIGVENKDKVISFQDLEDNFNLIKNNKENISNLSGTVEDNTTDIGVNEENIGTLNKQVGAHTEDISKNKDDIDIIKTTKLEQKDFDSKSIIKSQDGTYYTQSISHPNTKTYYYTTDIMNKDNLSDFVDSSKEGNILKVEGSKLSAVASGSNNKWKLVLKPEDFHWQDTQTYFSYIYPKPIKNTSQYKLYYALITEGFHIQGSYELLNNYINSDKLNTNCPILLTLGQYNFFMNQDYLSLFNFQTKQYEDFHNSQFWLYELEDAMEPLPTPAIPSKPILNKKVYYDNIKLRWK